MADKPVIFTRRAIAQCFFNDAGPNESANNPSLAKISLPSINDKMLCV